MKIPNNPITNRTRYVSGACVLVAVIALCGGHFTIMGLFGTAAAINLLVGSIRENY